MWKTSLIIRITNKEHSIIFIPDCKLLTCELDNFTFKVLHWVKAKYVYNTLTVPREKSKIVFNLIMKRIAVFPAQSKFPVKLIRCITFGSVSSACCSLISFANNLKCSLK